MIGTQIAAYLVALRHAALAERGGLARRMLTAWRDEVTVWAAWLQTHPDDLVETLGVLVTDVALARRDDGLPLTVWPAPTVPTDPPVEIGMPDGHRGQLPDAATLDRLGVMLGTFADWRIEVTLHDGSTVTARPAAAA